MFNFLARKNWRDHFNEGMAFGAEADFEQAEACFRKAAQYAPREPYPHYELGYTLFLTGRFSGALAEFRRAEDLSRGFFAVQREIYKCEQIIAGQLDQQGLLLLHELQEMEDDNNLNTTRAVELARGLVDIAPKCALTYYYLARTLFETDGDEARAALLHCLRLNPDETTAINVKLNLGFLRQQMGDIEEAREIWRRAIDEHQGNPHTRMCEFVFEGFEPQPDAILPATP